MNSYVCMSPAKMKPNKPAKNLTPQWYKHAKITKPKLTTTCVDQQ
jgi:hypothetical protein